MIVGIRFDPFCYLVFMGGCFGLILLVVVLVQKLYVFMEAVFFILPHPFPPLIPYSLIFRRPYAFLTSGVQTYPCVWLILSIQLVLLSRWSSLLAPLDMLRRLDSWLSSDFFLDQRSVYHLSLLSLVFGGLSLIWSNFSSPDFDWREVCLELFL